MHLRLTHHLHPLLAEKDVATVTCALLTTRLDCCNMALGGAAPENGMEIGIKFTWWLHCTVLWPALENNMEITEADLLTGTNRFQHAIPSFAFHAQFKVLIIIYKVLYILGPGYLRDCPFLHISGRSLWSFLEDLLWIPLLTEAFFRWAFGEPLLHVWFYWFK